MAPGRLGSYGFLACCALLAPPSAVRFAQAEVGQCPPAQDEAAEVTLLQYNLTTVSRRKRWHPARSAEARRVQSLAVKKEPPRSSLLSVKVGSVGCAPSNWLVPLAVLPAFLLSITYAVTKEHAKSVGRTAVSANIVLLFFQHLAYSVVIPSSFDVAVDAGAGATFSGLIVSAQQVGSLAGNVLMWSMVQQNPGLWNDGRSPWWVMVVAAAFNLVGAVGYCLCAYAVTEHSPQMSWYGLAIFSSRFVDGIGLGMNVQFFPQQILHCIPSRERQQWMASSQLAVMLGTGCGPLLAAVSDTLNGCDGNASAFAAVGSSYVGIAVASLISAWVVYPTSFEGVEDEHSPPAPTTTALVEGASVDLRIPMAILFLAMTSVRGFVISGLEVATSLILEDSYGWTVSEIGYAIGLCFLFSAPIKTMYNIFNDRLSTQSWIRVLTVAATLAASLLFKKSCALVGYSSGDCAGTLFVADSLLFPTLFLADALTAGMVLGAELTLPAESWFAPNMIMLYRGLVVAGGRFLAGPLARMVVAAGGRDAYALQQVTSTVLWLVLYEAFEYLQADLTRSRKETAAAGLARTDSGKGS